MTALKTVEDVQKAYARIKELVGAGARISVTVSSPDSEEVIKLAKAMYDEGIYTLLERIIDLETVLPPSEGSPEVAEEKVDV
jgi:hypothetical protein